jgi:hypothetical protein
MRPLKNVHFCSSSRKATILTTGIHLVFRGLQFETDAEIGQKGAFCKGLKMVVASNLMVSQKVFQPLDTRFRGYDGHYICMI